MTAARAGLYAARDAYRADAQSPTSEAFDSYDSRLARYQLYALYESNDVYTSLNRYAPALKANAKLYQFIRGIYNPISRLVDIETAKVYGGSIDWTNDLRTGAIPITGADETLLKSITRILKWSQFGSQKSLLVRTGAMTGDVFLSVVDDLDRQRVRLEVLDPRKVVECEHDEVGNVKRIVISYMMDDEQGKAFRYTKEIDTEWFRTYRDDGLYAFHKGINGEPIDKWPNDYGFVPVRHIQHRNVGKEFGTTSFAKTLPKINELNDQASLLNDQIRKVVKVTWAVLGGTLPDTRQGDPEARDGVLTINLPEGTDIKAMVVPLDIAGVIAAMDKLTVEIENDMPQLSLQAIRKAGGDATGVAIRNLYNDAVDLIEEVQGNYDAGLIAAIQMAISMGAVHGYADFTAYSLDSYEAGDLDFYLKPRPIFDDSLTKKEKLDLLVQVADKPIAALAMREMGYDQADIDEVMALQAQRTADAVRGLMQAAFQQNQTDQNTQTIQQDVQNDQTQPDPTQTIDPNAPSGA